MADDSKGRTVDMDFDAFEQQVDLEIDRLFSLSSISPLEDEEPQEAGPSPHSSPSRVESPPSGHETAKTVPPTTETLQKQPIIQSDAINGVAKEVDVDFEDFEKQVNQQIDALFGVSAGPLPEAMREPDMTLEEAKGPGAPSAEPVPFDSVASSGLFMETDTDGAASPPSNDPPTATEAALDLEIFDQQMDLTIDKLFVASSDSPLSTSALPPMEAKEMELNVVALTSEETSEQPPEIPESSVIMPAENETIEDEASPSLSSMETVFIPASADIEGTPPSEVVESATTETVPSEILLPVEDAQKEKSIELLSVALLTLDWDFSRESLESVVQAIINLEPYCYGREDATSIIRILRTVLKDLMEEPESASSLLMLFISDACEFLLSLLRSQAAPSPAEEAQLRDLIDRYRTLIPKGRGKAPSPASRAPVATAAAEIAPTRTPPPPAQPVMGLEEKPIGGFELVEMEVEQTIQPPPPPASPLEGDDSALQIPGLKETDFQGSLPLDFADLQVPFDKVVETLPEQIFSREPSAIASMQSETPLPTSPSAPSFSASMQPVEPPESSAPLFEHPHGEESTLTPIPHPTADVMESDEMAWLLESLDIAFVTLEWDTNAENIEALDNIIKDLEPFGRDAREAGLIAKVLSAVLQRLKVQPELASPHLLDFFSDSLEFLKLCMRTGAAQQHIYSERFRKLLSRLRALEGPYWIAPARQTEFICDPASSSALVDATSVMDTLDTAYLSLLWHFNVDNVMALDRAVLAFEPYCRKSREANSITKVLRAVLQRLRIQPDSVTPALLGFTSEALDYLKLLLHSGGNVGPEEKDRLKALIERLHAIKSGRVAGSEERDAVTADAIPDVAGEEVDVSQSTGVTLQVFADASTLREFHQWMQESRSRSEEAMTRLEAEARRLMQLEELVGKKAVLAPLASRLSMVRQALEEEVAAGRGEAVQWIEREKQLLDWEQAPASTPLTTEEVRPPLDHTEPPSQDLPQPVEPEWAETQIYEKKPTPPARREQVCLFDMDGESMAIPASNVVKFERLAEKRARKVLQRGYATLADFKPLFGDLRSGLVGIWNNVSTKDLKTFQFRVLPPGRIIPSPTEHTAEGSETIPKIDQPHIHAAGGIILVSNGRSHGLIVTGSSVPDFRDENIEATPDNKDLHGLIRTEKQLIRVLNLDAILTTPERKDPS